MLEQGKISSTQATYILINLVASTAVMFLPAIAAQKAGRDSWMTPLIATLPGIYLVYVIYGLATRYPGQNLFQYLQSILGTWPGKITGVFYILFFLHSNGIITREFGDLLETLIMPKTPPIVFHVIMVLLSAWAVRGGLEVISRTIEIALPVILLVFMIIIFLPAQEMEVHNLFPVMENGILPVLKSSLVANAFRGEIILLAVFLPFLTKPEESKRSALLAVIWLGFMLACTDAICTMVLGPSVARLTFPTFSLIRQISIGNFFERIDSILVFMWVIGHYGKIAIFYYTTVLGIAQLANLKSYRPLILPTGVFLIALSFHSAENSAELISYISNTFPSFACLFEYIIPTLLMILALIKSKK